ncbi:TonB-dependent receptor [Zobellia galactanivorans]|uniref:TonB-dependent receptor n=1 Tax=Zobellia galactanivorans (strain DSM 12802 / CCUG 47099 / CIP 106680 / NCIMB 13871 / Dsij) TaxID=63186 RepID=UPI001C06798C|nr:carboxypeptidase-like regulatory domain-containing protein [Zobellia galactanivorans]MBU3025865.1 carboxypeptidase-like regulatory domain-containing protein [Zobellia galactanivorans]
MKNIFAAFFLLVFFSVQCQEASSTISGIVTDAYGRPLSFASIILENLKLGVLTDDNGAYTIHQVPKGNHKLKVSYIGYGTNSKLIEVDEKNTNLKIDFALKENVEHLDEVTINGKTKKTSLETKGFAVNSVETKEAGLRSIQTNELLNNTVGVKIRQNGGLGSTVKYSLNGLSGRSVSIFIDGIPISIYGSSFSLNSIPPSMIKNIEVYKGVVPGHLSSDAVGGAINIVLHEGAKNNLNASVSYGSFNTLQTNLNGAYRFDKSGFTIKASAFHNYSDNDYKISGRTIVDIAPNGVETPIVARRFYDAYRSTGGMAQVGFTNVEWADQFLVGVTASDEYNEVQHGTFVTKLPYKGRFLESDAILGNLTYKKKNLFIKGLDLNVNGVYGKRHRSINDTVAQAYSWTGERRIRFDGEYLDYIWDSQNENGPTLAKITRNVSSVRSGLSYTINNNHKILLNHVYSGVDREDSDEMISLLENTFQQTSDLYKNIISLSYELQAFESKFKLNAFGKHYIQKVLNTQPVFNDDHTQVIDEVYQSDKDYTGYGFAASYAILPSITFLTSAEKAIRLPSENEVFGDAGDNLLPNLTIQPETSNNVNLGLRLGKFNLNKHGFTLTSNFFARNIENRIGLPTNADGLRESDEFVQYTNLENTAESKGIEGELHYTYNNNLGFNFNITRMSLTTVNSGVETNVPNVPLFTMNAGLRYTFKNFIQEKSRLNLFYNTYYTDEFSYKFAQGTNTTGEEEFLIPEQLSHDFGLSYTFPKENFVLSFDVKNIFDQAIYDNLSVQKPGRAFYLKLNYTINYL